MLSIHPEVQHFVDEDETNYETDEINKENMNEFCIFIADQKSKIQNKKIIYFVFSKKSKNTKHKAKYDK